MDLCANKQLIESFENLTPAQKANFTRAWNLGHKDPTVGVRGKKTKKVNLQESDEDEMDEMLDEEQVAEIKKAKQIEREKEKEIQD